MPSHHVRYTLTISEHVWRDFRRICEAQGTPVNWTIVQMILAFNRERADKS